MKRRQAPLPADPASTAAAPLVSPAWQAALSAILVLHLLAVFVPPLMFATSARGEGSPAVRPVYALVRPYADFMYLNHGYFFFAPDPGPTHLVRYELEFADGRESVVGEFPDRKTEWPRLLYHRHFMLSETLNTLYRTPSGPPEPQRPADGNRQARRMYERSHAEWKQVNADWQLRRKTYESLRSSIGEHLRHTYGASDVTMIRREHRPLNPLEYSEDRLELRAPDTYRELPEVPPTGEVPRGNVPRVEVLPWNPAPSR